MAEKLKLPTILVIADNPSIRSWAKKHLDSQFFVLDASDEEKALETVKTSRLDFILLDSGIDACDPMELCRSIRKVMINTSTPIYLITGRLSKTYRDKAMKAGVTDFLTDHLDSEELHARIATGKKTAELRSKTSDLFSQVTPKKKDPS